MSSSAGRTHHLKTWSSHFNAMRAGLKKFELRENDRDFAVGDVLVLVEEDLSSGISTLTGAEFKVRVTYLVQGIFGLPAHLCVMSIELVDG